MTITRILPAMLLTATLAAGPAAGQFSSPLPPGYDGPGPAGGPVMPEAPADAVPSVQPAGLPPAVTGEAPAGPLERISATAIPGAGPGPADPTPNPAATLAGRPPAAPGALPPGAYASPWHADGPGCCGPLGANGPIGYDLYLMTGPNITSGGGDLASRLGSGWVVAGGSRTLLFNQAADAAWALDLGLSYTYNRGNQNDPLVIADQGRTTTDAFGQTQRIAPALQSYRVRSVSRTSFNYGIGRDWFAWGPGALPLEQGWNLRFGADLGGRYGTAHVDLVPIDEPDGYSRRQKVYHGIYAAVHSNVEVPMGGWIWFGGLRVEYGHDWTNLVPPADGNITNINILLTSGVRF